MVGIRELSCLLKTWNHSIALYWVIRCCDWQAVKHWAVWIQRLLRKWRCTLWGGFVGWALSGTSGEPNNGWSCVSCSHGMSNILLLREVRNRTMNRSRAPNMRLVLHGVEDQRSEMLSHQFVSFEQIRWKNGKRLSLEHRLRPAPILSMGGGFVQRLRLSSDIAMLRDMVDESTPRGGWIGVPLI